jgi:hypothetical protein
MKKLLLVFFIGLCEQFLYTLYLLSVNKYLILISSIFMFLYMVLYLGLINRIAKDNKDSIKLIFVYSFACMIGNFIAMSLKFIK